MSNASQRVYVVGAGTAGVGELLAALEHDVSERRFMIVCDPGVLKQNKSKRGSADWKEHTNRRGKRRNWGKKR